MSEARAILVLSLFIGGLIAAFADGRNQAVSGSDIYAQRLLGNGAVNCVLSLGFAAGLLEL